MIYIDGKIIYVKYMSNIQYINHKKSIHTFKLIINSIKVNQPHIIEH